MNELKIIENEGLIKIYETDKGKKVVNARELHEGLESKQEFANWVKNRLDEIGAVENIDFSTFDNFVKREGSNLGTKRKEYVLTLSAAKEMAMLERNEKGKEYRKYLIGIEEKYKLDLSRLSPELQMFKQIFDSVAMTQLKQQELQQSIEDNKQEIQNMRDVITLSPASWRKDTSALINKIALELGGFEHIKDVREKSYKLLNERFGVDVQTRLTNKRRRMAEEGVSKSKRDKLTVLDVIADDKKLIEGYIAIVKEMAIKNKVA